MRTYYIIALIALGSFLITYLLIFLTKKFKIVDIPNDRSSHNIPTPRGGGLAIVMVWYLSITFLWFSNLIEQNLYLALLSGLLLAIISFVDDIVNLKPIVRLLTQLITSIAALYFLKGFNPFPNINIEFEYCLLIYPIVIIGMVWFINLFNFLDGIDGYASIEAITVAFGIYFFTGNIILLFLIASILGFLFWNWPKAKIFMGDVGSTQLGFILIVLGIYFHNKVQFSIIHWIMLTSPFWFDATFTLFRRWKNKEKLSQAHRKHAYQRIVQSGFSHLKTDMYLIILNFSIAVLIFLTLKVEFLLIPAFIFIILVLYLMIRQVDKRKSF